MQANDPSERFAKAVDQLLRERQADDAGPLDAEYRKDLILAAELAGTDFSAESTRRAVLRRKLLGEGASGQVASASWLAKLVTPWRLRPRLVSAAAAMLVLAIVVLHPGLRAAVVQPTIEYLKVIILGEQTQAVAVEEPSASELSTILAERTRQLEAGERWSLQTAVSTVGGEVPAGADPVILGYSSLGLARAAAAFAFLEPEILPDDFGFERVSITPGGGVVLWYLAPGERITLYQRQVRPGASSLAMVMGTDISLTKALVGDRPAAWMNDHKLVWEAAGVSYDLEGTNLNLEEALLIAESIR